MSSNLKVNSLVPATGTEIGIGTTGGSIDFRCPATFGGNVTIGGTLTYDEVINIDSIGIVTARSGLNVQAGQLDVGSNIKLGNAGVVTATDLKSTNFVQVLGSAGTSDRGLEVRSNSTQSTDTNQAIRIRNNSNTDTFKVSYKGYVNNRVTELTEHLTTPTTYLGDSIIHHGDLNTKIRFPAADTISFETAGSERLRITSAGNVPQTRIGSQAATDTTSYEIQLSGNANNDSILSLYHPTTTNGEGIHQGFFFKNSNDTVTEFARIETTAIETTAATAKGDLRFKTRSGSGGLSNASERLRITSIGDLLLGAHGSRIFDDSSGTNVVVDIYGGTTAGKRGILALGGRTGSDDADIGTIQFVNENNNVATAANHNQSKLVSSIHVKSETSDGNTGSDSGGHLIFSTKPETGAIAERLRITSSGKIEVKGTRAGSLQASDDDTLQLYTASTNNNIDRGAGITFYNHDNSGYEMGGTIQVAKENGTADNVAAYMRFSTRPAGGSATERLRITSDGKVGINQTPTRELSLHSPDNNNSLIHFTNDDTGETASDGGLVGLNGNEHLIVNNQESGKNIIVYTYESGDAVREKVRIFDDGEVRLYSYKGNNSDTAGITFRGGSTTQSANFARIHSRMVSGWGGQIQFKVKNDTGSLADAYQTAMIMDHNGAVTKPNTVAFRATHAGNQSLSSGDTITTWATTNSLRGHATGGASISSGIFTAPVTGVYVFHAQFLLSGATNTTGIHMVWKKNNQTFTYFNSRYNGNQIGYGGYVPICGQTTMHLDANENCRITISFGGTAPSVYGTDSNWGFWDGYLLG